jgi:hypothetical protein
MFTAALPGNVILLGANRIENTVSLLLLWFVYRAVAQERVDQICYIAPSLRLFVPNSLTVHHFPSFPGAVLSTSSCKFFSFFSPR